MKCKNCGNDVIPKMSGNQMFLTTFLFFLLLLPGILYLVMCKKVTCPVCGNNIYLDTSKPRIYLDTLKPREFMSTKDKIFTVFLLFLCFPVAILYLIICKRRYTNYPSDNEKA